MTRDGRGYYLVGRDGGVFTKGDARFFGSLANDALGAPIVAIALTKDGGGYWLVAGNGGIATKGDAPVLLTGRYGKLGPLNLVAPVLRAPIVGAVS